MQSTAMMLEAIDQFLTGLSFHLVRGPLPMRGVIPGVYVAGMVLHVDPDALISPGDQLHEAGHVAIIPKQFRHEVHGDIGETLSPLSERYLARHLFVVNGLEDPIGRALLQCGDGEAQAWSYAAAIAAGVSPHSVFHDQAYDGDGQTILLMMQEAAHFGVHGLAAAGMTRKRRFPEMIRWLQV